MSLRPSRMLIRVVFIEGLALFHPFFGTTLPRPFPGQLIVSSDNLNKHAPYKALGSWWAGTKRMRVYTLETQPSYSNTIMMNTKDNQSMISAGKPEKQ